MSASFGRKRTLFVIELAGAGAVIHGIGMWSNPSAWIVAGLTVVIAAEVRS